MSELKTIIDANIKENGNQEITGKTLNYVLNKIAEGTEKDWNESDATKGEYIKGRTHGVTYEHASVEGTLKELGYVPGEYVSVLHYARVNGGLEGRGLYLGGLLYNPIVGEEYRVKYEGPSVYAKVVEVEDGYDVQIKGTSDTGHLLKVAIVDYKRIDDAYISADIARKSQVDALEQKVDNLPQGGGDFDAEGNYPLLHVGTADDLAGRGESVPAEFGFRASGGKSIKDGRAYIKRIKGNSVVWNQLYKPREAVIGTQTNIGVTFTVTSDGSVTAQGTSEAGTNASSYIQLIENQPFLSSHIYMLVAFGAPAGRWSYMGLYFVGRISGLNSLSMIGSEGYKIFSPPADGESDLNFACWGGQTIDCSFRPQFYDLTQMFGAGNEPTTIEEFYARVATLGVDMNAYNEGQVIHCNTESIKSVGDNAWDEEWESGRYEPSTGLPNLDEGIRSKNRIKVLPNEVYWCSAQNDLFAHFYDAEGNLIKTVYGGRHNYLPIKNKQFTTPTNAATMTIYVVGTTTYSNDIMITLVHSGWKQDTDAGYQPYWQDILPLSIIRTYFPQGMKSAGSAHDEIRYNKASGKWEYSKGRMKEVDLGTLSWRSVSSSGGGQRFRASLSDIRFVPTAASMGNMLCSAYTTVVADDTWHNVKGIAVEVSDGISLSDSAYTDAAALKASLQGVMLYYESNDWEWVELDAEDQNFRDYYNVADFGTEMSQSSVPSAPFSADIIYQFNAVDMIREHEIEITELQNIITEQQSVIATMQAQLASMASVNDL